VELNATLYTPPGYDAARDGPLPMLMWAYPREFKTKEAASQLRDSPYRFTGIGPSSALVWLARGYAVLDGPALPIIGEGEGVEPNDTYVEQLVAGARAAVNEVVQRGVADADRIAVGGHSYGAFMAANLLAHAPDLFACAIARSGAYNRTLTPFGFQAEERTIWEAPETYNAMSPFMNAHKIKKPILLMHGEEDTNSGTNVIQSERFFAALKGNGAEVKLVILPHESHGYRAYESINHMLAETSEWLDTHTAPGAKKAHEARVATAAEEASAKKSQE
jgi:dipeptidyl aminopeptidase/acylaminoacyl peptidase